MTPSASPAWTALGWTFLHMLWIGAAVGLAASFARRLLSRTSAGARHAAALSSLVVLAASPLAAFLAVYEPAPTLHPARLVDGGASPKSAIGSPAVDRGFAPARPRAEAMTDLAGRPSRLDSWIAALPAVWLAGSMLTLASLATGLVGVERLRRAAVPLRSGPVAERCRELARALGIAREVGVAVCDRVAAPMLIGIVRPMILLPASALTGWAPGQVEMALLHELAHLRRHDNIACLFQKATEALLFFHPTTWWLSAWLRLERETCCDQLVVARTGRPRAYAELLAALAGAGPTPSFAPSLTERPVTTRIRRILLKEDRPMTMKPTAPEALALAAAALIAAALALPTRAEPPAAKPKADAVADLRRLAEIVAATPESTKPEGSSFNRETTLIMVARSQAERGDRDGALKTLEHVKIPLPVGKDLRRDEAGMEQLGAFALVASIRHRAVDAAGARADFRRAVDLFLAPDPAWDAGLVRFLDREIAREVAVEVSNKEPIVVDVASNDPKGGASSPRKEDEADREILMGRVVLLAELAHRLEECREFELMRPLADYGLGLAKLTDSPLTKAFVYVEFGGLFAVAGDEGLGRERIAAARKIVDDLPAGDLKDRAALELAMSLGRFDPDAALEMIRPLSPAQRARGLRYVLHQHCEQEDANWLDSGGIKITIDPAMAPKDKAKLRAMLPSIIAVAKTIDEHAMRARTLSMLAQTQARSDDSAGAMATAEAMPDLRIADHAGPRDGFYDSVKPATYALIAWRRAQAGDHASAAAAFARSKELARAVADEAERLVAWIVLAEKLEAAGRRDEATAVLGDAIPAALAQPEPRRSRMLAMLAEVQVRAEGVERASTTIDAIRDEPGVEKARALAFVARRLRDDGDADSARDFARRALACLRPRSSEPKAGPGERTATIRHGFIDYDRESPASLISLHRSSMQPGLRAIAGEADADPAGLNPAQLQGYLSEQLAEAYRRGGLDEALKAAESVKPPATRSVALRTLALRIAEGRFPGGDLGPRR